LHAAGNAFALLAPIPDFCAPPCIDHDVSLLKRIGAPPLPASAITFKPGAHSRHRFFSTIDSSKKEHPF